MNAPRLTEKVLTEDLPEALAVIDDNIAYLASSIETDTGHPMLVTKWREKKAKLERARRWIAGKIEAETAKRGGDAQAAE